MSACMLELAIETEETSVINMDNLKSACENKLPHEEDAAFGSEGSEDLSTDEGSSSDGEASASAPNDSLPSSLCPSQSPSRKNSRTITEGLFPSVGSAGHFSGECSRCCFFPKGRCQNGADCNFCHFDHDVQPRRKRGGAKSKAKDEANNEKSTDALAAAEAPPAACVECQDTQSFQGVAAPPGLAPPECHAALPQCLPVPTVPAIAPAMPAVSMDDRDTPEAANLRKTAGTRPVKIWLPEGVKKSKHLDPTMPAKKRPPFPEFESARAKALDTTIPVKKHVPAWLLGLTAR